MAAQAGKTAVIIGASRGLGYALAAEYLARGWQVAATARGAGRAGLHDLARSSGGQLVVETVDIAVPEQVTALHERLAQATFDLLFVNAGVTNSPGETVADVSAGTFVRLMVTNALSPMRVVETLQDLVAPQIRAEPVDAQLRRAPHRRPAHAATHGARLGADRTGRPRRAPDDRPEHSRHGRHDRGPGRQGRAAIPGLPGSDRPLVALAVSH
jgi:NAD(P)-dependent dehydrogenase (short-subunit alcohol dehydrogenase family)